MKNCLHHVLDTPRNVDCHNAMVLLTTTRRKAELVSYGLQRLQGKALQTLWQQRDRLQPATTNHGQTDGLLTMNLAYSLSLFII